MKAKTVASTFCLRMPASRNSRTVGEITEEQFDRMFDTNVKELLITVHKLCRWFGAAWIDHLERLAVCKGNPASRGKVRWFARMWTMDLKERKIRVNDGSD
jgi:NAD(P)-dependent dehydrogenase (short-subunit alcohol dehydrogenase family)